MVSRTQAVPTAIHEEPETMPTLEADKIAETVTTAVKDALYLSVGAGVLVVQKAQVRRQELRKQFAGQIETGKERFGGIAKTVEAGVTTVEHRIDEVLDNVQSRLPGQAADVLAGVRTAARRFVATAVPTTAPAAR
jgi:hypothetical protein